MKKVQKTFTAESSAKRCDWLAARLRQSRKWPMSWVSRILPSTGGARTWSPIETKPFREAAIRLRRREELRRIKRELEMARQERDVLKQLWQTSRGASDAASWLAGCPEATSRLYN